MAVSAKRPRTNNYSFIATQYADGLIARRETHKDMAYKCNRGITGNIQEIGTCYRDLTISVMDMKGKAHSRKKSGQEELQRYTDLVAHQVCTF